MLLQVISFWNALKNGFVGFRSWKLMANKHWERSVTSYTAITDDVTIIEEIPLYNGGVANV